MLFRYKTNILNGGHMTRNEFIKLLKDNLKPNAQMDFLVCDYKKPMVAFLDIHDVCMNADVDDPNNKNRGGIVFTIKEDLTHCVEIIDEEADVNE